MSFTFETVRRIECQPGAIKNLGRVLRSLGCRRLLIVTDPGIEKSGLLEDPLRTLAGEMEAVFVYSKVQADPPEQIILEAVDFARRETVDAVAGIGGGSSLDTAKLVALLARSPQKLDDIYGIGLAKGPRLPLVLAPTTAGTGSEATPIAIVTTPSLEKKGVVAPQLLPDVALLDPELTLSLPPHVTAATGIDAMVHAIEAFTSKHLKNPLSDALALKALQLLHANLRKVVADGRESAARQAMLEGSLMAGTAFANAPVAAVHALAYPLGARFHLPHGLCNALMLPHVLAFNLEGNPALYAALAEAILPGMANQTRPEASRAFVQGMKNLGADVGLPLRLRDAQVPESALPDMAADAIKIERLLRNNPRAVTLDDALQLYQQAW
jgi:alcohol dehydrogenase class IV